MNSVLDGRPALKKEVDKIAEVAGYLWQNGWAERNGGNITVNITDLVDDEIKALPAISEVKQIGTALPDFYGSITNTLMYKDFELDFMFSFSVGSKMINSTRATLLNYTSEDAYNLSQDIMNMWQIEGQQTDIPKLNNKSVIGNYDYTTAITTTRFLENNSYLRLKTITFTYNFPQTLLARTKFFNQLKVFATMTNVFTLTKYSGVDPEVSAFGSSALAAGYDNMTMPQSRSMQFGVRASF